MTRAFIVFTGIASIAAGLAYFGIELLAADFLGPEAGSERETVRFWGICSIVAGSLLLSLLVLRPVMKEGLNDGLLILILGVVFVIQLPPFGLWLFGLMASGSSALFGLLLHGSLLASVCATLVSSKGSLAKRAA